MTSSVHHLDSSQKGNAMFNVDMIYIIGSETCIIATRYRTLEAAFRQTEILRNSLYGQGAVISSIHFTNVTD